MSLIDGPRVVSLVPSATDIMAALGAGDLLVGVSHSCDGDWAHLPVLTSTLIDKNAPASDIDAQVENSTAPLYELDIARLEALAPDIVISQDLCDVCAVPSGDVDDALKSLPTAPELVTLAPFRLADIPMCFEQVGQIIGVTKERVRQIQNKALEKLRSVIENDGRLDPSMTPSEN